MELKPFKLDIDELIHEYVEARFTTLAELKKIWKSRKFSFIFEASPTTNHACFMQSLFDHTIAYMVSETSLSHRLGGLYCLYCLYKTQPFNPPFKVYLSLGQLKRLKNLVVDAKQQHMEMVGALVKYMLQNMNMFLFGSTDMTEIGSMHELIIAEQNALVQVAYQKLFANTKIGDFIHMDLGTEIDVAVLKEKSSSYAAAKELAIREAGEVVDVENIKHTTENVELIGDVIGRNADIWSAEKELFHQKTGFDQRGCEEQEANRPSNQPRCDDISTGDENKDEQGTGEFNDDFSLELEEALLYDSEIEDSTNTGAKGDIPRQQAPVILAPRVDEEVNYGVQQFSLPGAHKEYVGNSCMLVCWQFLYVGMLA